MSYFLRTSALLVLSGSLACGGNPRPETAPDWRDEIGESVTDLRDAVGDLEGGVREGAMGYRYTITPRYDIYPQGWFAVRVICDAHYRLHSLYSRMEPGEELNESTDQIMWSGIQMRGDLAGRSEPNTLVIASGRDHSRYYQYRPSFSYPDEVVDLLVLFQRAALAGYHPMHPPGDGSVIPDDRKPLHVPIPVRGGSEIWFVGEYQNSGPADRLSFGALLETRPDADCAVDLTKEAPDWYPFDFSE